METNQPAKERESLEQAAQRLLAKLNARKKQVAAVPVKDTAEIQGSTDAPRVEKEAGEIGAYSSLLTGQSARRGQRGVRRDAITAANDNRRADLIRYPLRRVMPAVAARPYSDDSADQIARMNALRGSEWEY